MATRMFQSPQKPKGDCDFILKNFNLFFDIVPITPKAERRLWLQRFLWRFSFFFPFQSPQKPKGDCDLRISFFIAAVISYVPITPKAERRLWQSYRTVQIPCHHSGSNHPKSRKAIVTFFLLFCCQFTMSTSSNHPKSRKAIVTVHITFDKSKLGDGHFQSPQQTKGEWDL